MASEKTDEEWEQLGKSARVHKALELQIRTLYYTFPYHEVEEKLLDKQSEIILPSGKIDVENEQYNISIVIKKVET